MKVTKKDVYLFVLIVLVSIPLGIGMGEVIPYESQRTVRFVGVCLLFTAFFSVLRFPRIAPKLHRRLVKSLGLKTDH